MSDPYSPPSAEVEAAGEQELASRGARLAAAVLDAIVAAALILPLMFAVGAFDSIAAMGTAATIALNVLSLAVFTAVHGYLLATRGQTIGKSVLGIKIVGLDGRLLSLPALIGKRYAPVTFTNILPVFGPLLPLIDVLFIFSGNRRCVHDLIAGTKVVKT